MNRFKDTVFCAKFFAFIFIPLIIMVYISLKSVIYNFSLSTEEIKEFVDANLMYHPYATAITVVINLIASVGILLTSCCYEKNYKVRKIFLVVFALISFIILIKNIVIYSVDTYRHFSDTLTDSVIFEIASLVIIFLILLASFLKFFLAAKLLITNKKSDKLIIFVAIYVAFISFINIFVGLVNSLQYDLSLSSLFAPDKLIGYVLNAYSGFCFVYFGFRKNSILKESIVNE